MKRLTTKILTIAACAAMMLTAAPLANTQSVQAAVKAQGTVDLTTQKLSIPKGVKTAMVNKTVTMVKARRYQVKAKFGKTIVKSQAKWKSSKPAVVTVSSTGLITAKAPGTATIKVTYGKKSQTFKVKVIASHTHSWKTISKSTCATKGKKLCKTCGGTGTTALAKTHNFEVTKKATCETKGVETCVDCGLKNALPKTAHKYVTETAKYPEGRGKKTKAYTVWCPGCMWDMTNWTRNQVDAHQGHIDAILEGKLDIGCFNSGYTGADGEIRYEKYMLTETTETYCKYCGAGELSKKTKKDLYYCDMYGKKLPDGETDPWASWSYENYCKEHGFVLCENCNLEVMPGHECPRCHIVAPTTASTTASVRKAAARKAVASPQDVITEVPDNNESFEATDIVVSDNAAVSEDTVSEDIISGNEAISDNAVSEQTISENEIVTDNSNSELNTEITDPDQGGDSVFGDSDEDGIVIENTGDSDGIIIKTVEDGDTDDDILIEDITDESDDGADDYDGSEGEIIEDE